MRWSHLFAALFGTLFFTSCGLNNSGSTSTANPGKHPSGTGPFDRQGNYVEAWADNPSKWSKKSSGPSRSIFAKPQAPTEVAVVETPDAVPPTVATADQPPADAVPLPAGGAAAIAATEAKTRTIAEAETKKPTATTTKKPRVSDDDDDAKPVRTTKKPTTTKSGSVAKTGSKASKTSKTSKTSVAKTSTKSKTGKTSKSEFASKSTTGKSKATAKSTTSKTPKAKSKTSTVRYTVKKGESLAAIAKRNKTTVTAIQKANGLKGTTVSPGKTIVVPKY